MHSDHENGEEEDDATTNNNPNLKNYQDCVNWDKGLG